MADKLKTFLRVVAHTLLSFIAVGFGGGMFYAFVQPIVGKERYNRAPHIPMMVVLLLFLVALGGVVAYRRWADHCAFLAWVLPAVWVLHLVLSRTSEAME